MLISRLNVRKYPWANPKTYLIIPPTTGDDLDPVFAGRIAAFVRSRKTRATCTSAGGRRDSATQLRLYKTLPRGQAAIPGTSWHEFGLAWDTADQWLRSLYAEVATAQQTELLRFGLYKPMTRGNRTSVLEPWHIQPVETIQFSATKLRPQLAPLEYSIEQKDFQTIFNLTPDGINGPNSMSKAQEVFFGRVLTL